MLKAGQVRLPTAPRRVVARTDRSKGRGSSAPYARLRQRLPIKGDRSQGISKGYQCRTNSICMKLNLTPSTGIVQRSVIWPFTRRFRRGSAGLLHREQMAGAPPMGRILLFSHADHQSEQRPGGPVTHGDGTPRCTGRGRPTDGSGETLNYETAHSHLLVNCRGRQRPMGAGVGDGGLAVHTRRDRSACIRCIATRPTRDCEMPVPCVYPLPAGWTGSWRCRNKAPSLSLDAVRHIGRRQVDHQQATVTVHRHMILVTNDFPDSAIARALSPQSAPSLPGCRGPAHSVERIRT